MAESIFLFILLSVSCIDAKYFTNPPLLKPELTSEVFTRSPEPIQPEPRILNGKSAVVGQFPWVLGIGIREKVPPVANNAGTAVTENPKLFSSCSATLIGKHTILTAGHCVKEWLKGFKKDKYEILIFHRVLDPTKSNIVNPIKTYMETPNWDQTNFIVVKPEDSVVIHTGFKISMDGIEIDDIAIISLREEIPFDGIKPACLDGITSTSFEFPEPGGSIVKTAGYGTNEDMKDGYESGSDGDTASTKSAGSDDESKESDLYPDDLPEVTLTAYDNAKCLDMLREYTNHQVKLNAFSPNNFCTYDNIRTQDKIMDVCPGDSGSSVNYLYGEVVYVVGVVNGAYGGGHYGQTGLPSVQTMVRDYIHWMRTNVPNEIKDETAKGIYLNDLATFGSYCTKEHQDVLKFWRK